jgi:thiamine-phosphate pyrophosphorylase
VAAGADVLHLGQDDLPIEWARKIVGDDVVVGRSSHSAEETATAAAEAGVDYFCVGPCWPTPTKPGRPAPGLDLVRTVAGRSPSRPWFAIGGIDHDRLDEVLGAGADRIVVVRAITDSDDPRAAAATLAARLRG